MNELIDFYYDKLSTKVKMNISKEKYLQSVPIIEAYIDSYDFSLKSGVWRETEKCFVIPLSLSKFCHGVIKIDKDCILVAVNKDYSDRNVHLTEYIKIVGKEFIGRFEDYVPNFSRTKITVEDKLINNSGTIVTTKFSDREVVNPVDGQKYEYIAQNESDKVEEAFRFHEVAMEEQYNNFMSFEDLNIININIHKTQK